MTYKTPFLATVLLIMAGLVVHGGLLFGFQIQREIAAERVLLRSIESELAKYRSLAEERKEIRKLDEEGNNAEISRRFQELADIIEEAYISGDIITLDDAHLRMKYLYRDVAAVEDLYTFYDALYHYLNGDVSETLEKMKRITSNFPSSSKLKQAVNFSQAIHLVRNHNAEYIELYGRYPELSTPKMRYWLAQAYYNLGEYEEADSIFGELETDPQYGFRSQMMIGMIAFASYNYDLALETFITLNQEYTISQPYYDFAVLSLARLYSQLGFFESSLNYYANYFRLKRNVVPTELAYEKALVAKEAGRTDVALSFLRHIINIPQTSSLFDKALSQIAIIQAEQEDISSARQIVEDVVESNKAFMDLMSLRTERLDFIRTEVDSYFTVNITNKNTKQNEINRLLGQLAAMNERQRAIGDFGVDKTELELISFVTEEYSFILKNVLEMDNLIDQIALRPNDKKSQALETQATEMDSLRVDLITLMLLSNMTFEDTREWSKVLQPSAFRQRLMIMSDRTEKIVNSHREARSIARNIVEYENINNAQKTKRGSTEQQASLKSVIDLLYLEAEIQFGEIDHNNPYVMAVNEELSALTSFRNQLLEVKEIVARYYHQRLAERLARNNRSMFEDSEYIHTFNISRINNFIGDLDDMNLEYNYALLDVQFKEVLKMDREYSQLRSQMDRQADIEEM